MILGMTKCLLRVGGLLRQEVHPAITSARAAIFDSITCGRFEQKCRETLDGFASHFLLLGLLHHGDGHIAAIHGDNAALGKLLEIGLHRLAMRAPISIIHREGSYRRSTGRAKSRHERLRGSTNLNRAKKG